MNTLLLLLCLTALSWSKPADPKGLKKGLGGPAPANLGEFLKQWGFPEKLDKQNVDTRSEVKWDADWGSSYDVKFTPLLRAATCGDLEVAQYLVGLGADISATDEAWGDTPLYWAAFRGRAPVVEFLVGEGADVEAQGNYHWTPLHAAAYGNCIDCGKFLLAGGAKVDAKGNRDWTPLHRAVKFGRLDFVKFLVENGARTDVRNNDGETPMDFAVRMDTGEVTGFLRGLPDPEGAAPSNLEEFLAKWEFPAELDETNVNEMSGVNTPLVRAAKVGDLPIVEYLVGLGADLESRDMQFKESSLHWAALRGHASVVEFLVGKGADVGAGDKRGSTPLHYAALGGCVECGQILLAAEADVNAKNNDEWTSLHYAALRGHLRFVSWLVENGATKDVKNTSGETPLDVATSWNQSEVAEYLRGSPEGGDE